MPSKQKKILIVEDERPMARALELKLENSGFKTRNVYDGKEALEVLKKNKFDLILLDLVMPNFSGFDLLLKLKQAKNKTPVIVSSNLGQEEDIKRSKDLSVLNHFVKSDTSIVELVSHIEKLLSDKKKTSKTKTKTKTKKDVAPKKKNKKIKIKK